MKANPSWGAPATPLVLIANDQEWTARAIATILTSNGCRTVQAYTAREALDVAAAVQPDLVILDQQLPDFSGVEVCRQLRADERFGPTLPIIITTAGPSGRPQRLSAYEAGAWEFYGQPLDAEALLHKLRAYLASYRETRELRARLGVDASGLYVAEGLERRATEAIAQTRRDGASLSCVGWSLGGVADTASLARAGETFRRHGRSADVQGRLAADDLVLITTGRHQVDADRIVDRFRALFAGVLSADAGDIRSSVVRIDQASELPADGASLLRQLALTPSA